ncbi:MAG: helix-turn-helix domain-containing protein [Myxococcota bacterium]
MLKSNEEALIAAIESAERGDGSHARALFDAPATAVRPADRVALAAALSFLEAAPPLNGVQAEGAHAELRVELRASEYRLRAAAVQFEVGTLRSLLGHHERLLSARSDVQGEAIFTIGRAWLAWLDRRAPMPDLERAFRQAQDQGLARPVIELQALRALDALDRGALNEAVELSRRGSRMARAEGFPAMEILANTVLARIRRFQGRPYLTLRIITALYPHAPPVWQSWLQWEAAMAGLPLDPNVTREPAVHLATLMSALRHGADASDAVSELRQLAVEPLHWDATRALALFSASRNGGSDGTFPALRSWQAATAADVPPDLSGLAFLPPLEAKAEAVEARLVVTPDGTVTRLPAVAVRHSVNGRDALDLTEAARQPRAELGLAELASSAAGTALEDYFRNVYGFAYDPALHESMLSMNLLRMRRLLGENGTIERADGTLWLAIRRAVVLRDPRSQEDIQQRALRILAKGSLSARSLAAALGVSLRSAQRALSELQQEGAVESQKQGRTVAYQVEDTTFSEPTRSRRFDRLESNDE